MPQKTPKEVAEKSNPTSASGAAKAYVTENKSKPTKKCKSGGKTPAIQKAIMSVLAISQIYVWGLAIGILVIIILYILSQTGKEAADISDMIAFYPDNDNQMHSIFISKTTPHEDFKLDKKAVKGKLSNYMISSSYNSCCAGDFLDSYVSIAALTNVINQGARVLDFSIYLVNDNGPTAVVGAAPNSSTNIKGTYNHLNLVDVFNTIRTTAMKGGGKCTNWNDPLFIHLRIMSAKSKQLYKSLAEQFAEAWPDEDISRNVFTNPKNIQLGDVPLIELRNKIVIMITDQNVSHNIHNSDDEKLFSNTKKFLNRVSSFYDYKNVEFAGHIVQKNQTNAHAPDIDNIKKLTRRKIYIIVPDELSINDNMHFQTHHDMGCQMVCMNWQNLDGPLETYRDKFMFQNKDTNGNTKHFAFILKSKQLRHISMTITLSPALPDTTSTKPQCKKLFGSNLCL